ncbi:MAG TPA: hypothetical protein VIM24_07430, partial [Candidatus Limnocylindrales bacterium]
MTTSGSVSGVVPQRCTLVLPSGGTFDSRAWRIASAIAARGHEVTVMARLEPGLETREDDPAGYRIIRVPVSAVSGLPRPLRWLAARVRGDRGRGHPPGSARAVAPAVPNAAAPRGRLRSVVSAAVRLAAIALTVRSQRLATRPLAPPADLVHAMAYMGIPIGLDLGRRDRAAVVYDARDIYVDAANIARLPGPARRVVASAERHWA